MSSVHEMTQDRSRYGIGDHPMERWAERVRGERLSKKAMKAYVNENEITLRVEIMEAFVSSRFLFQKPYRLYNSVTQRGYYIHEKLLIITDENLRKIVTVYPISTDLPEPESSEIINLVVTQIFRLRAELEERRLLRKGMLDKQAELTRLEKLQAETNQRITEIHNELAEGSHNKIKMLERKIDRIGSVLIEGRVLKLDGGIIRG